jgi:membrane associated rhomboid family serine protease
VFGHRAGGAEMRRELWGYAVVMFLFGFFMSAVNNWAHLGGFAGGWLTGRLLKFEQERRESVPEILFALGLLGLTVAGFVLSFITVTGMLMR